MSTSCQKTLLLLFTLATVCNCDSTLRMKLEKHGPKIDEEIQRLLLASSPDYLRMQNIMNTQYNANVSIGSHGQSFNVQIDTGSGWLWVTSSTQTGDQFTTNRFNCSASSTCYLTNIPVPIQYGVGAANGTIFYDTVSFGNGSGYTVKSQTMLIITNASDFTGFPADGLCGLGFNVQDNGIPTFLDNLQAQGIIQNKSFSLYLSNDPNGNDANSELIIGGFDVGYMTTSNFIYLPVVPNNIDGSLSYYYWSVGLAGINLGSQQINIQYNTALLDSGTTLIAAPPSDWQLFANAFLNINTNCSTYNASGLTLVGCPCTGTSSGYNLFPNLTFILSGTGSAQSQFNITPAQYLTYYSGMCLAQVQSLDGVSLWILGDIFMINYYTYFNVDLLEIGVSPANPNPKVNHITKSAFDLPRTTVLILFVQVVAAFWMWI